MLQLTTTNSFEGRPIREYRGIVTAEVIFGTNIFRDIVAGIRDFFGGRTASYEKVFAKAKQEAMEELSRRAEALGANAIVGVSLDYETVGSGGSMLMVVCSGTAVVL